MLPGTSHIERWFVIVIEKSKINELYMSCNIKFQVVWYVRPAKSLISLCICAEDKSLCQTLNDYMTVKLLTEQHLEFFCLKGGFTKHLSNVILLEITCCVAQNENNQI